MMLNVHVSSLFSTRHKKKKGHPAARLFVADLPAFAQFVSQSQATPSVTTTSPVTGLERRQVANGFAWCVLPFKAPEHSSHFGKLEASAFSYARDLMGQLWAELKAHDLHHLVIQVGAQVDQELLRGVIVGLDLAAYQFKNWAGFSSEGSGFQLQVELVSEKNVKGLLQEAQCLARATNVARHLVNTPPNLCHPLSLQRWIERQFKVANSLLKVEVWDEKKLEQKKCGLLLAVGRGAEHGPRLVRLRYRGPRAKNQPIAFIGKGITFDSGGLDIKPSSAMRLMKKDMGGAAAVLGVALYCLESKLPINADFYVALAENSVDAKSFRPSDVLTAANGLRVEIHNTDAEGRLALADAITVALNPALKKDIPEYIIDVATLTGAIKATLGTQISGLFANDDGLATQIEQAASRAGEWTWRVPMVQAYTSNFSTPFADLVNAVDGFGGPITAALFIEKFVEQKKWAHFDMYAWADKPTGAITSAGANGQCVQTLVELLRGRVDRRHGFAT